MNGGRKEMGEGGSQARRPTAAPPSGLPSRARPSSLTGLVRVRGGRCPSAAAASAGTPASVRAPPAGTGRGGGEPTDGASAERRRNKMAAGPRLRGSASPAPSLTCGTPSPHGAGARGAGALSSLLNLVAPRSLARGRALSPFFLLRKACWES